MEITDHYLLVLAGPTAVGKTELAIELAKWLNTSIISADSRQFFQQIAIGTAKPTTKELNSVPHFLVDHLPLTAEYSAGQFEKDCLALLNHLFKTSQTVILTGGSGMYIDAVLNGVDDLPLKDDQLREQLSANYKQFGIEVLQNQLKQLDPDYYLQVDKSNPQRLMRAIEVCQLSGTTYSALRKGNTTSRPFKPIKICLNRNRDELYQRINSRVDSMLEQGLVEEVKSVLAYKNTHALKTVGYKEIIAYLEGNYSLETATDLIKQNTRRFAKRQLTWFRRDPDYKWFNPTEEENIKNYINYKITLC